MASAQQGYDMRKIHGFMIGLTGIALCAGLAWAQGPGYGSYRGTYRIEGGTPADRREPTAKDVQAVLTIEGVLAARMYREMGRRAQQKECVPDDAEIRERGDLDCQRNKASGAVTCYIAIDLRRGKSTYARVC
jgi:hypothetical protein